MTTESTTDSGQPDNAAASSSTLLNAETPDAGNSATGEGQGDGQQQQASTAAAEPANTSENKPAEGEQSGTKTEEGKPDEGQKTEAPETYQDFKTPEGVTLDAEVLTEFKDLAKDLKLDQDSAQKFVDLAPKLVEKWQAKQAQDLIDARTKWAEDTLKDKEIGSTENLAVANSALKEFGSPELVTLLQESGFGNHPALVRTFYRIGKAMSEDSIVTGKQPPQSKGAQSFYSNSNMNP